MSDTQPVEDTVESLMAEMQDDWLDALVQFVERCPAWDRSRLIDEIADALDADALERIRHRLPHPLEVGNPTVQLLRRMDHCEMWA